MLRFDELLRVDSALRLQPVARRTQRREIRHGLGNIYHKQLGSGFHSSAPARVLPIIAAGVGVALAATTISYVIRAGKRMKADEYAKKAENPEGWSESGIPLSKDEIKSAGEALTPAFGIDFGTSNMRIAFSEAREKLPQILENREGARATPSAIYTGHDVSSIVAGKIARSQRFTALEGVVLGSDIISKGFNDKEHGGDLLSGALDSKTAGVLLLKNLKDLMEYRVSMGGSSVMSVPPYFDDHQVLALHSAGEEAGLNVLGTVPDPVAAVVAAEVMGELEGKGEELSSGPLAVLDVGACEMSCSVVERDESGAWVLRNTEHSSMAGGALFEDALVKHLNDEFVAANGISLLDDCMSKGRLYDAAEIAVLELCKGQTTFVNLPFVTADASGPKHLEAEVSRALFERTIGGLVEEAEKPCIAAISDTQIRGALLVGGGSRVPCVQAMASRVFHDVQVIVPESSEEVVVIGAAVKARDIVYGGQ